MAVPELTPQRVVAFRVAAHGLAERDRSLAEALAGWSVQDSPPGSAAVALHARVPGLAPDALQEALGEREVVATYNVRSATVLVPAGDLPLMARALDTDDPDELRAILGSSLPDKQTDPVEAAALATDAIGDALDGRVLSRDALHEELRARLPESLLPWCRPCASHHARRGLIVIAGLRMRICHAGRAGRQPAFARADQWIGRRRRPAAAKAAAELTRRHLRASGPSTPSLLARWAELSPPHAARAWALVEDELAEVRLGRARRWLLAEDLPRLLDPAPARGARLLPAGDPLLQARDRELLIPDEAVRKRLWRVLGSPGLALVDGRPLALWRARKAGARLIVTLEPLGRLPAAARRALEDEASALAPHRGCASAQVELSGSG